MLDQNENLVPPCTWELRQQIKTQQHIENLFPVFPIVLWAVSFILASPPP